jgi:hypothetical protein
MAVILISVSFFTGCVDTRPGNAEVGRFTTVKKIMIGGGLFPACLEYDQTIERKIYDHSGKH